MAFLQLLLFIGFLTSTITSTAYERITSFTTNVVVQKNGMLWIEEIIAAADTGSSIKRGIVREFPLRYKDRMGGSTHKVSFSLTGAWVNGVPVISPLIKDRANGLDIYVGNEKTLRPGDHQFRLAYQTGRQLGFFENHDELYYNLIGTGWPFVIEKGQARIQIPYQGDLSNIKAALYTGTQGSRDSHASINVIKSEHGAEIIIETTSPLQPYQGLTVVIGWPKGVITRPTVMQKIIWFFSDNIITLLLLLLLFGLIIGYLLVIRRTYTGNRLGIIIPRFEAPAELSPAGARTIFKRECDSKALTAQLVGLAVKGYLELHYQDNRDYLIKGTGKTDTGLKDSEKSLLKDLGIYQKTGSFNLYATKKQGSSLALAQASLCKTEMAAASPRYFYFETEIFAGFVIASIIISCAIFLWAISMHNGWVLTLFEGLLLGGIALAHIVASFFLTTITPAGKKMYEEILGFMMFLTATEKERLERMTDIQKTPEMYETFLPYAIALDVENQWHKQFQPLFDSMKQQGNSYRPVWFHSTTYLPLNYGSALSRSIDSAIASTIAAAPQAPGSSSGFGSGSSGGGGGGGGGRGF